MQVIARLPVLTSVIVGALRCRTRACIGDPKVTAPAATTLAAFLAERAARHPDAAALIDRDRPVSWGALDEEARRVARRFAGLAVERGDRVALWLPNLPAWLACFFACARLGAIAVSINTRFRSQEVEDIVGRSGCKVLVCWPGFRNIDFTEILSACDPARLAHLAHVVAYGENDPAPREVMGRRPIPYAKLCSAPPLDADCGAPDAACIIFPTSGTTNAPKFVLHDQRGLIRHAADVAADFGYHEPDVRPMTTAPLCGVFGFCNAMASLSAERTLVMLPTFDARETALAVQRHRVTHTHATDEMIAAMLAAVTEPRPFPSVRWLGFGATSPAHADLPQRSAERGLNVVGIYGSSEIQALFARQREDAPIPDRWLAGGHPVAKEARVRATDPETRAVLPHGQPGELEFVGPSRMVGYFGDEAAMSAATGEDGYFRSGDLGYTVEDGRFVFLQRLGDAIRLAGFLVSPAEIEEALQRHASIAAAQVVGATSGEGVKPVAFVILRSGATLDEPALIAHCAARIAKFKVPVRVVAVDEFPVTPGANATKVQKHKLKAMAEALLRGA